MQNDICAQLLAVTLKGQSQSIARLICDTLAVGSMQLKKHGYDFQDPLKRGMGQTVFLNCTEYYVFAEIRAMWKDTGDR